MTGDMHQPPRRDVSPPVSAGASGAARKEEIASVPRRYGPGTLLVVTAAYAVLFTAFRAYGAQQEWWIGTAVFLTGVGIAQMIAGPKKARAASAVAGLILLPLAVLSAVGYSWLTTPPNQHSLGSPGAIMTGITCAAVVGVPLGYIGGTLVAGIFLIMRYADNWLAARRSQHSDEHPLEPEIVDRGDE